MYAHILNPTNTHILINAGMGERSFTYDHVFGPQVAQGKLYEMTARPMLKPFLEGYNVTIIAYGQTGSGKTYTMGSEATCDYGGADSGAGASTSASSPQGLIPRFVEDLFAHLQQQQQQQEGGAQQQQREANVRMWGLFVGGSWCASASLPIHPPTYLNHDDDDDDHTGDGVLPRDLRRGRVRPPRRLGGRQRGGRRAPRLAAHSRGRGAGHCRLGPEAGAGRVAGRGAPGAAQGDDEPVRCDARTWMVGWGGPRRYINVYVHTPQKHTGRRPPRS